MALVVTIDITSGALRLDRIAQLEVKRLEKLDERNESHDDEVHPYRVRVIGTAREAYFDHRYGAGYAICVEKAMQAIEGRLDEEDGFIPGGLEMIKNRTFI